MQSRIFILKGDITKQSTDAIVNAANTSLLGGGGVDGAIHRSAGPRLLEECKIIGGCPTGEARLTKGYNLPAKYIIHTVGPYWSGGKKDEEIFLSNCYKNCFKIALENGIHSISFPAISTGAYRFPIEKACKIAIQETISFLKNNKQIEKVIFVCFDDDTCKIYSDNLKVIDH